MKQRYPTRFRSRSEVRTAVEKATTDAGRLDTSLTQAEEDLDQARQVLSGLEPPTMEEAVALAGPTHRVEDGIGSERDRIAALADENREGRRELLESVSGQAARLSEDLARIEETESLSPRLGGGLESLRAERVESRESYLALAGLLEESLREGTRRTGQAGNASVPPFDSPRRELHRQRQDEFQRLFAEHRIRFEPPRDEDLAMVPAEAVVPPREYPRFWDHHGYSRETYFDLGERYREVLSGLRDGRSLDELRSDPSLRFAIEAFWSPREPVRLVEFRGTYFVESGFHRVLVSQELGLDRIPARVVRAIPLEDGAALRERAP